MKTFIFTILIALVCQALYASGIEQNLVQNLTEMQKSDEIYFVVNNSEDAQIIQKSFVATWNFSSYKQISPQEYDNHEFNEDKFYIRIHEYVIDYSGYGLPDRTMLFLTLQKGKNKKDENSLALAGSVAKTMTSKPSYDPMRDVIVNLLKLGFFMQSVGVDPSEMAIFGESIANSSFKFLNAFCLDVVEDQTDDVYKIAAANSTYLKGKTLMIPYVQIEPEVANDEAAIKAAYPYPIKIVKMEGADNQGMITIKSKPSKKEGKVTMEELSKMAQEKIEELKSDSVSIEDCLYGLNYVDQYNLNTTFRVYDLTSGKLVFVTPVELKKFSIKQMYQIFNLEILKDMAKFFEGKI
jgi:hypothetical protein